MATSEARIQANRANSLKSCGPKTLSGKLASRRNGLKHGLTGAGIVIAEIDQDEVERRNVALVAELGTQSTMGQILVQQMATLSVRMERCAEREAAAVAERVRNAPEAFDQARLDEVDRLMEILPENPRLHLRKLRAMPEGVEALVEAWEVLKGDLTRDGRPLWTARHREQAENLVGYRAEIVSGSRIAVLSKAIAGDFHYLSDQEGGNLATEARQEWARREMIEQIDAEIAELEEHYQTLDFDLIELDRLESPKRALFDPSKEATLARRYESEARRLFFKAMKELPRVEQEYAESQPPAPTRNQAKTSAPLASSWEKTSPPRDRPLTSPPLTHPMTDRHPEIAEYCQDGLDRPSSGSA